MQKNYLKTIWRNLFSVSNSSRVAIGMSGAIHIYFVIYDELFRKCQQICGSITPLTVHANYKRVLSAIANNRMPLIHPFYESHLRNESMSTRAEQPIVAAVVKRLAGSGKSRLPGYKAAIAHTVKRLRT